MKVLFGFNKDDVAKSIANFYEQKYNEKLEQKTVYYYKSIIEEASKNSFDRIVILEELEQFPVNNYAQIDEYLFKNIDRITDEFDAKNIIFIASDRRRIGDEFLTKLFNLGVYNVLTAQDRIKSKVTEIIRSPKTKKDVKQYYEKSAGNNVYQSNEVSELEIQKILVYYRNLGNDTSKYVETFDRVSEQYTTEQMRIIINFLPQEVRTFLRENSDKYRGILQIGEVNLQQVQEAQQQTMVPQQPQYQPQYQQPAQQQVQQQVQVPQPQVVQIQQQPEIVEKIVIKQVQAPPQVITEVVEKEVVKSVYQVPKDYKKMVCLVGPNKSGTTFCINALATHYTRKNIKTAIIDMTRKRDTYYMYTYDNEGKRSIAAESLKYASNGLNEPLIYGPLSIYTAMPGEERRMYGHSKIVDVVKIHNSVVLMDCDFTTPYEYYRIAQEIYLIQDMDVLNIGQTTLFLRELKNKGIPLNKLKIVINKHIKCKLTSRDIIDGMSTYTTPDLKSYDELFSIDKMEYFTLPFETENYAKYTEMMFKYSNLFNSFTKNFQDELGILANVIYPVGTSTTKSGSSHKVKSSGLKNNYNKMKNFASDNGGFETSVQ